MENPLKQFYQALDAKEQEFLHLFKSDNLGLILRVAINELDWGWYNLSQVEKPTYDQVEHFYVMRLGVSRLIKLALEMRPSFDVPTVMIRRDPEKSLAVLEIVASLGMIEHGRRISQTVLSGLCRIEQTAENDFLVTLPSIIFDHEYGERAISSHYRDQSKKWLDHISESDEGKAIEERVNNKLAELVYPFGKHFIGYGGDPLLDRHFFEIALYEVQHNEGYDTFGHSAQFGGISYQKYLLALTFIVSLYTRHVRFAEKLVQKDPSIELENILTISSDSFGLIESIKDALNFFGPEIMHFDGITFEEASRIFEVLSLSRKNTGLLNRAASPLPFIIQNSDRGCYRCLAGANDNPVQFLLDSLRHHFPQDYDKNQQSREKSMQRAVKRVLDEGFAGLGYLENIKIRENGRVLTDIDIVVTERDTGVVLLCQLKHQELYGTDLQAKHIRTTRLKDQVGRWVSSVKTWIDKVGEEGLRSSLRLSKTFPPLSVYCLIISRHYAYPLKELTQNGTDVVYANWNQFFNAIELVQHEVPERRGLKDLISILKSAKALGESVEYMNEPRTKWTIGNLNFTVYQEDAPDQ